MKMDGGEGSKGKQKVFFINLGQFALIDGRREFLMNKRASITQIKN